MAFKACDAHGFFWPDCAGCQVMLAYRESQAEAARAHQGKLRDLREALAERSGWVLERELDKVLPGRGSELARAVADDDMSDVRGVFKVDQPGMTYCRKHSSFTANCGECAENSSSLVDDAYKARVKRNEELQRVVEEHLAAKRRARDTARRSDPRSHVAGTSAKAATAAAVVGTGAAAAGGVAAGVGAAGASGGIPGLGALMVVVVIAGLIGVWFVLDWLLAHLLVLVVVVGLVTATVYGLRRLRRKTSKTTTFK